MPISGALRRLASPDVEKFFQSETAVLDANSLFDALLDTVKADGGYKIEDSDLEVLQQAHESSNSLCWSSKEAFTNLWHKWLNDYRRIADKSVYVMFHEMTPEIALNEHLPGFQEQLEDCKEMIRKILCGALAGFRWDTQQPRAPQATVSYLKQFTEAVNLFLLRSAKRPCEGIIDSVFSFLPCQYSEDTTRGEVSNVAIPVSKMGTNRTMNIVGEFLSKIIAQSVTLILEVIETKYGGDGQLMRADEKFQTRVRACFWILGEAFRMIAHCSTAEIKSFVLDMIDKCLENLSQVSTDEYEATESAMNAIYDILELLDMCDIAIQNIKTLEELRQSYHEQLRKCLVSYQNLACHRLGVLPARSTTFFSQPVSGDISLTCRLQTDVNLLKQICQDTSLHRLLIVLYGGIPNLGYTVATKSILTALAFEQAPPVVQLQIMQLQTTCASSNVVKEQFRQETKQRRTLARRVGLLKSCRPIFRLGYAYRRSSAMDRHLLKALLSKHVNPVEFVLMEAVEMLRAAGSSLTQLCDAACCISAAGDIGFVVDFLKSRGPFAFQVAMTLAESLLAYSEPACRQMQQLFGSDCFHSLLLREEYADTLQIVLRFSAELGGEIDTKQISQLLEVPNNCNIGRGIACGNALFSHTKSWSSLSVVECQSGTCAVIQSCNSNLELASCIFCTLQWKAANDCCF